MNETTKTKEQAFLRTVGKNPSVFQYTRFVAGTPYITSFDQNGRRTARHVSHDEVIVASKLSTQLNQPVLTYDNGVYCWSWGPDVVFLFVEPELAHALMPNRKPITTEFVPMANGETYLGSPSLSHLRRISYDYQKRKIAQQTQQLLQRRK